MDSLESPTQLLTTARSYPPELRGQFEFPGGKLEPDEPWLDALHRELREELGVEVSVGPELLNPDSSAGAWPIMRGRVMRVWFVSLDAPLLVEPGASHIEVQWRPLRDLPALPWLRSNRPIIDELLRVTELWGGGNRGECGSVVDE